MSTPHEDLNKQLDQEIERIQTMKDQATQIPINLFVQAFPEGHWYLGWSELSFSLPFRFELIEKVRQFVIEQMPTVRLTSDRQRIWGTSKVASHFLEFRNDDWSIKFEVEFRTTTEGSTCILNKIGEEIKVVPIYEVICEEGAREGTRLAGASEDS